jgi:hypothetical protein
MASNGCGLLQLLVLATLESVPTTPAKIGPDNSGKDDLFIWDALGNANRS